jgi:cell division protein FtsN
MAKASGAKKSGGGRSGSRGGFAIGLVVGLLLGLALALGVALYITKVPVPFVDKLPQRTAEQDKAEAERNRDWDPNKALAPNTPRPASVASAPAPTVGPNVAAPAARDPAAILSGAPSVSTPAAPAAFTYLIQVGAYTRADDAEAQRAKLAMQGFTAKVQEREQAGRTVYRVRLGPFDTKAEADALQGKLQGAGIDGQLVRVQKP